MPSNKSAQNFAEPVEEIVEEEIVEVQDDLQTARIKGTWLMHWGTQSYNFEDGKRYRIPRDLYAYLRKSGNIYDTL